MHKYLSCDLKSRDEVWILRSQSNKHSAYENKEVINKDNELSEIISLLLVIGIKF